MSTTPVVGPAIGPAVRGAFDGYQPSLTQLTRAIARKYGGAIYDPSNLASMFQDSNGTLPVTGVDQPVGLALDVQYGLARGSELVVNGDFSSGTAGWTALRGGVQTTSAGVMRITNGAADSGRTTNALVTTPGKTYVLTHTKIGGTGTGAVGIGYASPNSASVSTTDGSQIVFTATGSTTYIILFVGGSIANDYYEYRNISVREIPGNHLTQSTPTARPMYQLVDGKPCIVGDGVDDSMNCPSLNTMMDGVNPWWCVAGFTRVTGDADWRTLFGGLRVSQPNHGSRFGLTGSAGRVLTSRSNEASAIDAGTTGTVVFDVPLVISGGFTGAASTVRNGMGTELSNADTSNLGVTGQVMQLFYRSPKHQVFSVAALKATPTAAEQALLIRWAAQRSGVTL